MRKSLALGVVFIFFGCATTAPPEGHKETKQDVQSAVEAVATAITGQEMSEEELRELNRQIREDKEAQSAVQSITNTLSDASLSVKYCPVTGKRYSSHLTECPQHHVKLKELE